MNAAKKRRVLNWTIVGAISGFIVSTALYLIVDNNPAYFIFTVFGALMAGAQGYLSAE